MQDMGKAMGVADGKAGGRANGKRVAAGKVEEPQALAAS